MVVEKNYAVSLLRFIAMIFIVLCHFLQFYDLELAWWFNVGVQIFLCISGFLYGNKKIDSPIDFIGRNFKKILIPYYCFFIPMVVFYSIFLPESLNVTNVINSFLTGSTIKGLEHLWFISYILFCYLITPYLYTLTEKMKKLKWYMFLSVFSAMVVLGFVLSYVFKSYFDFSRIVCYLFGYFGAVFLKNYDEKIFKILTFVLTAIMLFMNSVRVYAKYIKEMDFSLLDLFISYAHALLGICIVFLFVILVKNIKNNLLLSLSDKYSFYIYIVHQFYILSPFNLLTITACKPLNWCVTIISILLSAIILKFICGKVNKLFDKTINVLKQWSFDPA